MSSPVFDPLLGEMVLHEHAASATPPGGSDTQMQYNNAGVLGGTAKLVFDGTYIKFPSLPTSDPFVEGAAWNSGGTLKISNGAPPPFDPSDISGLKLWLKADAITGLNDGDAVTTWSDSSGQGNDATQSVAGQKPLYKTAIQNGLPSVRFDATNDVLKTQADGTLKPFSIFAVIKVVDLSAVRVLIGSWNGANDTTATGGISIDLSTTYKTRVLKAEIAVVGTSTATPTTATLLIGVTYDGSGNYAFYKNGVGDGSGTNDQTFTAGRKILIGAVRPDGTAPFNGDAFEIVVYDSVLDSTQRGNVQTYLNDKWAVY